MFLLSVVPHWKRRRRERRGRAKGIAPETAGG
jgi:hypothetical protein